MLLLLFPLLLAASAFTLRALILDARAVLTGGLAATLMARLAERLSSFDAVEADRVDADIRFAALGVGVARILVLRAMVFIGVNCWHRLEHEARASERAQGVTPWLPADENSSERVKARGIHERAPIRGDREYGLPSILVVAAPCGHAESTGTATGISANVPVPCLAAGAAKVTGTHALGRR